MKTQLAHALLKNPRYVRNFGRTPAFPKTSPQDEKTSDEFANPSFTKVGMLTPDIALCTLPAYDTTNEVEGSIKQSLCTEDIFQEGRRIGVCHLIIESDFKHIPTVLQKELRHMAEFLSLGIVQLVITDLTGNHDRAALQKEVHRLLDNTIFNTELRNTLVDKMLLVDPADVLRFEDNPIINPWLVRWLDTWISRNQAKVRTLKKRLITPTFCIDHHAPGNPRDVLCKWRARAGHLVVQMLGQKLKKEGTTKDVKEGFILATELEKAGVPLNMAHTCSQTVQELAEKNIENERLKQNLKASQEREEEQNKQINEKDQEIKEGKAREAKNQRWKWFDRLVTLAGTTASFWGIL